MASTKKKNDSCYFNMLCEQTKKPGLYNLNTDVSINNNKCYPKKYLKHPKANYKNTVIENNLFNLNEQATKCIDGNTLDDKKIQDNNILPECNHDVNTTYIRFDLNNLNRGLDTFTNNFNLYNNPNGNHLNHVNHGPNPKCPDINSYNDKCFIGYQSKGIGGNDMQSIIGSNTRLNSKDYFEYKLNNLNSNDNNNSVNNYSNNSNTLIHETNSYFNNDNCNCNN